MKFQDEISGWVLGDDGVSRTHKINAPPGTFWADVFRLYPTQGEQHIPEEYLRQYLLHLAAVVESQPCCL